MMTRKLLFNSLLLTVLLSISSLGALAQEVGTIKGLVFEDATGEPMIYTTVILNGTTIGTSTDLNGYFSIPNVPVGDYVLRVTSIGYATDSSNVTIAKNKSTSVKVNLKKSSVQIKGVNISARKQEKKTEVKISSMTLTPRTLGKIPTIGGEADLAQYLQVLPGVVFTGDQGGQIYIRGGAAINTLFLIDGMPVYNPFHSIGLFSTYETEIIKNVEVMTGGFNAEYGNRTSAVIDVKTRDGNKKRFSGKVSASPFMAKAVLEGPLMKLNDKGASISFLLSNKTSYLDKTSKALYSYVSDEGIPYSFNDTYGKLTFGTGGGSKVSLFGFNFRDKAKLASTSDFDWNAFGAGMNFVAIPDRSNIYLTVDANYSSYEVNLTEGDGKPRFSAIRGFNVGMDFTSFKSKGELKYGFEVTGFRTEYEFTNALDFQVSQNQNTTELAAFMKYRKAFDKVVIEPSLRFQYYGSLGTISPEPRLGMKFNISDDVRLKLATGIYSQNLISTKSDRDVVNLFSGFLSGPEETLLATDGGDAKNKLQRSFHLIGGIEYDLFDNAELNIEPYYINSFQVINVNRNKLFQSDPNFAVETGKSYGIDLSFKYDNKRLFVWTAYSLGYVKRFDGEQTYPPHFDRRHNLNIVGAYTLGKNESWEVNARWNLGSGFPFTRTQGFFEEQTLLDGGVQTPVTTSNGNLGIIYEDELNQGRLPYYHRLDLGVKKTFLIGENSKLEAIASVTNAYDRENIFYFDRVRYERVNQLPILPSLAVSFSF